MNKQLLKMIDLDSIYSHSPEIVARKTGEDYVLVPVTNDIADMKSVYTLNSTAAFIWDRLDGEKTVKNIITELVDEFDIDRETALKDVIAFFRDMKEYLIIVE